VSSKGPYPVAQNGADGWEQYSHASTADETELNTKTMAARACLSVSFMVCDLRSHADANDIASHLASLFAAETARAVHHEVLRM
jgi:hypothetical protein